MLMLAFRFVGQWYLYRTKGSSFFAQTDSMSSRKLQVGITCVRNAYLCDTAQKVLHGSICVLRFLNITHDRPDRNRETRPRSTDTFTSRSLGCFVGCQKVAAPAEELRNLPLLERKRRLRRVVPRWKHPHWLRYLDHIDADRCALYRPACERNLERIVAKR
jgi:hypothetical protein